MRRSMQAKPAKPSPDFPLFPHSSGKWAKKIKNVTRYFGRWDDPDAALAEYIAYVEKHSISRPSVSGATSVRYGCNLYLTNLKGRADAKEVSQRTWTDMKRTCARMVEFWGPDTAFNALTPDHFTRMKSALAKTWNPVAVGNEVTRVRTVMKWLRKSKRIDDIETGPDFKKPSALVARRYRRSVGKKLYSAKEIRAILDESGVNLNAIVLLGINCGYQNSDCELLTLEQARLAIETGWLDVPRNKTEVERRCHLWRTTRTSLRRSLLRRPSTSSACFFVLPDGRPYSSDNADIAKRFRSVRDSALVGRGGYSWLRKTFETVGGMSKDQVAVDYIMGHVDPSMGAVYRQEVQDERLEAVSKVVYDWLFGS